MPKFSNTEWFHECGAGSWCQIIRECPRHSDPFIGFADNAREVKKMLRDMNMSYEEWHNRASSDCKCNNNEAEWVPYHPLQKYGGPMYLAAYCATCKSFIIFKTDNIITFC